MARDGNDKGATGCVEAPRVLAAVRLSLSEENLSPSSLPSLSPELKQHLASCASCAAAAVALDPTLLFAPLAASVAPDGVARGARASAREDARLVASAVLDEVRRRARVTSPMPLEAPRSTWSARRLAQAAAAVVLTAGLAGLVRWETGRPLFSTAETAETPTPPVAVAQIPPDPIGARPLIEGVRNPNARVYEFAAASPEEPVVVFVANPNADL